MKKEHTSFISELLSNHKLSLAQRDKVVELALRDLSKNGSEKRILKDLELIKEKLEIMPQVKSDILLIEPNVVKRFEVPEMREEERLEFQEQLLPEEFEKYFGENQEVGSSIIAKKNNEESQPVEKRITTEEFVKRKLDKLTDPDLVLKNNKAEKKNNYVSVLPTYIESKPLYNFLFEYNQHPVLRYTCHEIDDEKIILDINKMCGTKDYDLIKHQELIQESFELLAKAHYVNYRIKNLILVYLNGISFSQKQKTWSTEKIKYNWKSPELLEWAIENPGVVPSPGENLINKIQNRGFKFKKAIISELSGERITSFSGLVIHFKNLFHIKGDNPLQDILKSVNQKEGWDEIINFQMDHHDFWINLELFTDVDKFIQAYKGLIRIILDAIKKLKLEKPFLKLIFKEEGPDVIFSIHHLNSVYGKTVNNTLARIGDSQKLLIENQINGLCDLFLKADFDHSQYAKINLWNGEDRQATEIDKFQGVQYILKFKK